MFFYYFSIVLYCFFRCMKYIVLSILSVIGLIWGVWAQQQLLVPDDQVRVCEEHTVELIGSQLWIVNKIWRYGVKTSLSQSEVVSVEHELWRWDEFITSYTSSLFDLEREEADEYRIKTLIQTNNWCTYVSQFKVSLYDRVIAVVWEPLDEVGLLSETVDSKSTKIIQLLQDDLSTIQWQEYLQVATTILIDASALSIYLETLSDRNLVSIDRIYIISDLDLAAYRKLLATHSAVTAFNEIIVIERSAVWSFFTNLLLRPEEETQITRRQVFEPGSSPSSSRSIMWQVIEKLLTYGVSLQIIRFFLLIPLLALIMTILRQVVWFTTYSIWYPLIVAWCGMMIGWSETWLLLAAGWLSVLLVAWLTKTMYLLSGAKTALIWGLYALICLVWYYFVLEYDLAQLEMIDPSMLLYVIMLLYVCMSIFRSPSLMLKGKRWIGIVQFIIVTYTVVFVFKSDAIFDLLLTFPDSIRIILLCIMIAWRFTWLQLTEYARFMPLISYLINEEEE